MLWGESLKVLSGNEQVIGGGAEVETAQQNWVLKGGRGGGKARGRERESCALGDFLARHQRGRKRGQVDGQKHEGVTAAKGKKFSKCERGSARSHSFFRRERGAVYN